MPLKIGYRRIASSINISVINQQPQDFIEPILMYYYSYYLSFPFYLMHISIPICNALNLRVSDRVLIWKIYFRSIMLIYRLDFNLSIIWINGEMGDFSFGPVILHLPPQRTYLLLVLQKHAYEKSLAGIVKGCTQTGFCLPVCLPQHPVEYIPVLALWSFPETHPN